MSKKFKSQASSARAASSTFGSSGLGFGSTAFQTSTSPLSYVTELPDLERISNPSVKVTLKNLTKKDGVTKAKALEELLEFLSAESDSITEQPFLDAWVEIYPRTSIDNARRVRQLAHIFQGALTAKSGKAIAPLLPKITGPWLAGSFDNDKVVSRAAAESFRTAFPSEAKRSALWEIYQKPLLGYLEDAILHHTPQTLSDERTTSPDDSNAKHARVVSSGLLCVGRLLQNSSTEKPLAGEQAFQDLMVNRKVYEFAIHEDAGVRKALYRLLSEAVNRKVALDWTSLSKFVLAKALKTGQLGSSGDYIDALVSLTESRPSLWTSDSQSKTPISRSLCAYISKGSQRGPESWWPTAARLTKSIPANVWASGDSEDETNLSSVYSDLLKAFRDGVGQKDESRRNLTAAWMAYLDTIFWTLSKFSTESAQDEIIQSFAHEPIQSYLLPSSDSRLTLPTSGGSQIALASAQGMLRHVSASRLSSFYETLTAGLVELMKRSQPQQSQKFSASQDDITAATSRFTQLQLGLLPRELLELDEIDEQTAVTKAILIAQNDHLIVDAVKLLRDREAKPYGCAGLIYTILERVPALLIEPDFLSEFLQEKAAALLESPSAELLVLISVKCRSIWAVDGPYERFLSEFLQSKSLRSTRAYTALLHGLDQEHANRAEVQNMVLEDLNAALGGDDARWANIQEVLTNKSLMIELAGDDAGANVLQTRVLDTMMKKLSLEESELEALNGFERLLKSDKVKSTLKSSGLSLRQLLQRLIMISHSSEDESADKASKLLPVLRRTYTETEETSVGSSTVAIINSQLDGDGPLLPISSLVEMARESLGQSKNQESNISSIFPTSDHWEKAVAPFLQIPPALGSAMMSPGGFAYLIDRPRQQSSPGPFRDSDTYSTALRLCIYVTRLLEKAPIENLSDGQLRALYYYYPLVLQLVDDKGSIESANAMWIHLSDEVADEFHDMTRIGWDFVDAWADEQQNGDAEQKRPSMVSLWVDQLQNITDTSPLSFRLGRAASLVLGRPMELPRAYSKYQKVYDQLLSEVRNSPYVLRSAATIRICWHLLDDSAQGTKLANELVTNAMDVDFDDVHNTIKHLALLNVILRRSEGAKGVSPQRLIFLAKHLLSRPSLITSPNVHLGLQYGLFVALKDILPPLKDLYGEFWQDTVTLLSTFLKGNSLGGDVSPIYAAFQLYESLCRLVDEDCNEDLQEALAEAKPAIQACFVNFLSFYEEPKAERSMSVHRTATILARHTRDLQFKNPDDLIPFYPLLNSEEAGLQLAAYSVLIRSIPDIQQELSIETALSKTVPHLPDELLSLLLDAPTLESLHGQKLSSDGVWINLRRYLLAWKVAFYHIEKASHVVQSSYVADIKDHGHLDYLLELICDIVRITGNKPLDPSKVEVKSFQLNKFFDLEREGRWLTIHLYYLSLLHLPSLSKNWFLEQKNRIKIPLEAWSKKYICSHIIAASLSNVSTWHATTTADNAPDNSGTDQALILKINPRASEIIASIAIDPDSPPISLCITLPPTYPLTHALVSSRTRVIVSEQKWQSWLRTIQGIINFPSVSVSAPAASPTSPSTTATSSTRLGTGGLIDGLIVFHRNVQASLKGQTECAICYSVIGTELKVPDKRCATCKNVYHGDCLFRWFRSSNGSTCPLCRNKFHYA